jgi:tight adherence protein C
VDDPHHEVGLVTAHPLALGAVAILFAAAGRQWSARAGHRVLRRVEQLQPTALGRRGTPRLDEPTAGQRPWAPLTVAVAGLGGAIRRCAGRPADDGADRRAGTVAVATLVGLAVGPLAAVAAGVGCLAWARHRATACDRRDVAELVAALPEVIDLFALAASSGLNLTLSVDAVARRAPPPIRTALTEVVDQIREGARTADGLEACVLPLGEPLRPLVTALVSSERYGTPILPALERLAADARVARRRASEEAARRVPVRLLFPLVFCVLPAFALLTVAPLLAGTLRALRL